MTGHSPRAFGSGPVPLRQRPHVIVIGGGASGVLMALHLLTRFAAASGLRITIIEEREALGRGLAYSTATPDLLLNTRVRAMSAVAGQPEHFLDWLAAEAGAPVSGESFVSRDTYGRYLESLLQPWTDGGAASPLRRLHQAATAVEEADRGVTVRLADGGSLRGDLAILATGHVVEPPDPDGVVRHPWDMAEGADRDGRIVIAGSGLSMVDCVVALLAGGHRGQIVAVSRRGLLPRPHAPSHPFPVAQDDIPLGAPASALLAWARRLARQAEAAGGTWRDAVDGIRPQVQAIWRHLPQAERARFLRHAATWWDIHRHRIPPESERLLRGALASGQLWLRRGAFLGAAPLPAGGCAARLRPHGERGEVRLPAAGIVDCRGIRRDPERHASPLVGDLLARGRARIDPLRIGLDVDTDCRLLDAGGHPSPRLLAIGPATRAAFWEITGIPEIREQADLLARRIAATFAARG